jgi:asparagine synthase (glutamine-hydrolysing)
MCGIAGALSLTGQAIDPAMIGRMASVQAHRGPDGEGAVLFSSDGRFTRVVPSRIGDASSVPTGVVVALAHRRLAIIDLSERGAQPMADQRERCWITFNGEIYNYVELRDELAALGHRFHSDSGHRGHHRGVPNGDRAASNASTVSSRSRCGIRARGNCSAPAIGWDQAVLLRAS